MRVTDTPRPDVELDSAWGPDGAQQLAARSDLLVVIDVLSFSTAVDVAVSRGAEIVPGDPLAQHLNAVAAAHGAILAGRRASGGYTLSPASLQTISAGTRLLLPSPNGSAISATLGKMGKPVILASFRNATAVAGAARRLGSRIGVVLAGEMMPGGRVRRSEEDWLGLGALARALAADGAKTILSEDARRAVAEFTAVAGALEVLLAQTQSGRELIAADYPEDVRLAAMLDVSDTVPVLDAGVFKPWPHLGVAGSRLRAPPIRLPLK